VNLKEYLEMARKCVSGSKKYNCKTDCFVMEGIKMLRFDAFTTDENLFLTKFQNKLSDFVDYYFTYSVDGIKSSDFLNIESVETAFLLIVNNAFYQNIEGFFILIERHYPVPAFNNLRSAIEIARLFRLLLIDDNFRKEYIENENLEFRTAYDKRFTQGAIIKQLELLQRENICQNPIFIEALKNNKQFTKNSMLSEIHSELSKWSHGLNANLFGFGYIEKERVCLLKESEYGEFLQLNIKKYLAVHLSFSDSKC
jgi:hypothetical protein